MTIGAASALPRVVGRYQILSTVGRGAIAEVVRARDAHTGDVVALKILYPHLRDSAVVVERFRREVEVVRRIRDPHVLAIHDVVESDGLLFLVMDYHPGGDLADRIARKGPLDGGALRTLTAQLCGALAAAHRAGIVHRDVKPSNVLCGPGDPLDVRLCDFGLARTADFAGLTTASAVLGTPEYMAPEIIAEGHADPRSDIYSLGVVLFEAATGRLPFAADSPYQLMREHLDVEAPRAASLTPGLPRAIDEAIARALAKDPLDRFATAADLVRSLTTGEHAPLQRPLGRAVSRAACPACGGWLIEAAAACADCGATQLRLEPVQDGADVLVVGPGAVGDKVDARTHVALYKLLDELPPASVRVARRRRAPRIPFYVARSISQASARALVARLEALGLSATADGRAPANRKLLRKKVKALTARYMAGTGALIQMLNFVGRMGLPLLIGVSVLASVAFGSNAWRTYRPLARPTPPSDENESEAAALPITLVLPKLARRADRRLLGHILVRCDQLRDLGRPAALAPFVRYAGRLAEALAALEERRAFDPDEDHTAAALIELRAEEQTGGRLRAELLRVASRLDDLALVLARAGNGGPELAQVEEAIVALATEADARAEVEALLRAPS